MKVLLILSFFLSTYSHAEEDFRFKSAQGTYLSNVGNNSKSPFYNGSIGFGLRILDMSSKGVFGTFQSSGIDFITLKNNDDTHANLNQYSLSGSYTSIWYHPFGLSLFEGEYYNVHGGRLGLPIFRFSIGPYFSFGTGTKKVVEAVDGSSATFSEESKLDIVISGLSVNLEVVAKLKYIEFSFGARNQYAFMRSVQGMTSFTEFIFTLGYNWYER